jgi:hypothetical protein
VTINPREVMEITAYLDEARTQVCTSIQINTGKLSGDFWASSSTLTAAQVARREARIRSELVRQAHLPREVAQCVFLEWRVL